MQDQLKPHLKVCGLKYQESFVAVFAVYNRFEQKKNKDQNSNKRFALFTWSCSKLFPFMENRLVQKILFKARSHINVPNFAPTVVRRINYPIKKETTAQLERNPQENPA